MTRQPLHFASDEDRTTYRKSMRALAGIYGTIIVLAIGGASLRAHSISSSTNTATNATADSVDVANLTKFDR